LATHIKHTFRVSLFFFFGKDWLELSACVKIRQIFIQMILCLFCWILKFAIIIYIYNNSSSCYSMLTILMRSMENNESNFVGKCWNREFGKLEGNQAIKNQHWGKCNPSHWGVGLFKGHYWKKKIGKLETYQK